MYNFKIIAKHAENAGFILGSAEASLAAYDLCTALAYG